MGKAQKPFIAARIPIGLEEALEKHTKSTGESKTTALIHALANYVGWSQDKKQKPSANDRLSLLEERIEKLEKLMQTPQQTSLLELEPVIDTDNKFDNKVQEPNSDNSDNTVNKADQENIIETLTNGNKEKEFDNTDNNVIKEEKLFTHKEFSKLTGIKLETIRSKYKTKNPKVEWEGKTFEPKKFGKTWKWQRITQDNSVIN